MSGPLFTDESPAALCPGPTRDALIDALHALDIAEQRRQPMGMSHALAQVGRAYRTLGAIAQAESYFVQSLRWAQMLGAADFGVDLVCELAELAAQQADALKEDDPRGAHSARERARDHCFEAAQRASRAADAHWEIHVLLRVSDVLDRCGDHNDAIALQCRALHLLVRDELPAMTSDPRGAQPVM